MSFYWPDVLWLLLIVPVLVWVYILLLRRKKRTAIRFASLSMVKEAIGDGPGIRRHIPAILLLTALTTMIIAMARPSAVVTLPSQRDTVLLAMDVSGSMRAEDVDPNRMIASQNAAKIFISEQPASTRIGVVAFAGSSMLVQNPTLNREEIIAAIDRFQFQRGTNIGGAMFASLQTIFPEVNFEMNSRDSRFDRPGRGSPLGSGNFSEEEEFVPVEPGSYMNAAVVILTDGQATTGPDPIEVARIAADRGVRFFTVGFGSLAGETVGFGGMSMRVQLDEETLRQVAEITRGRYFHASSASDLNEVYSSLTSQFFMETERTEITAIFSAAAALMVLVSAALSLLWFNRIL